MADSISRDTSTGIITATITTASNTDVSTYLKIPLSGGTNVPSAHTALGDQNLRIAAAIDTSGGTAASLTFVLTDGTTVFKAIDVTVTVRTSGVIRTGIGGSSGNYLMDVTATTNDFIDLTGLNHDSKAYWAVGLAGAFGGSGTTLTLYLMPTRAI